VLCGVLTVQAADKTAVIGTIEQVIVDKPPAAVEPAKVFAVMNGHDLLGSDAAVGDRLILVRIEQDRHGVLPGQGAWETGARVIAVVEEVGTGTDAVLCAPFSKGKIEGATVREVGWIRNVEWINAELEQLRPIPLYCGRISSLFLVQPTAGD